MTIKWTRHVLRQPLLLRAVPPAERPKWHGNPRINLDRYASIKEQIAHVNRGKWGGNIRRNQPLWQHLDEAEQDSKLIAYAAGHPSHVLQSAKEKKDALELLEKKHPMPDPVEVCHLSWEECGIDNILSALLTENFGHGPTYAQSKVLPFLLSHSTGNAQPGDVLGSMPAQSGKTTLLLIGLMHALRTEDAGLNMLLCRDSQSCYDCYNTMFGMLDRFQKKCDGNPIEMFGANDRSWIVVAPFRDDAESYESVLMRSLHHPRGPVRILITTADVWNEMEMRVSKGKLNTARLGYLRRLYADDIQEQLALPPEYHAQGSFQEYDRNPPAINLMLAHMHQRLSPPTRALLQMALLSKDVDLRTKNYLRELCLNIYNTKEILTMRTMPSMATMTTYLYYHTRHLHDYIFDIMKLRTSLLNTCKCVIVVKDGMEFLQSFQRKLLEFGTKAHSFNDIFHSIENGKVTADWGVLLLTASEHEILRYIPEFTHLVLVEAYSNRFELAQICKTLDQSGMSIKPFELIHFWPSADIRYFAETLQEMHVEIPNQQVYIQRKKPSIVAGDNRYFSLLSRTEVYRRVKPLERWDLEPQKSVQQRYVNIDDPVVTLNAELKRGSTGQMFAKEDYTPVSTQKKRHTKAKKVHAATVANQEVVSAMLERGMLNQGTFKPTKKMWDWLHE